MWSDITSWIADKTAGLKVLAADFNLIISYIKKVYDNTVYLKTLVAAISNTTLYTSSNYAMTDTDGLRNIFVYANTGDVTITLPKKSTNLNRPVKIVYVKGGTYKVIVNPHADDANTLSTDGLPAFWLAKVGDNVEFIENADTGFWIVVNERITSQLRLNTYAGYGSTDNKIMRLTNVVENVGNMFSENHSSGYSGNAKGLEIIMNRSGWASVVFNSCSPAGAQFAGLSLNSSQLTTAITSINIANKLGMIRIGTTAEYSGIISVPLKFIKGDVIRLHADGTVPNTAANVLLSVTYLGQ